MMRKTYMEIKMINTNQARPKKSRAAVWLWAVAAIALIAGLLLYLLKPASPVNQNSASQSQQTAPTSSTPPNDAAGTPNTTSDSSITPSGPDTVTNGDSSQGTTPHRLKEGLVGGQK
jgi:cytoskeletal protein RodZ